MISAGFPARRAESARYCATTCSHPSAITSTAPTLGWPQYAASVSWVRYMSGPSWPQPARGGSAAPPGAPRRRPAPRRPTRRSRWGRRGDDCGRRRARPGAGNRGRWVDSRTFLRRLRETRRDPVCALAAIAAPAVARHVVRMHVRAGCDVGGRRPDGSSVIDEFLAGPNRAQRDLVSARNRLDDRELRRVEIQHTPRVERVERRRDVITRADHNCGLHWFTPLARKPPSTTISWPVTNVDASDARYTAAPMSSSSLPNRFIGVRSSSS